MGRRSEIGGRAAGMVAFALVWGAAVAADEKVEAQLPNSAEMQSVFLLPHLQRPWALEGATPFLEEHLLPELRVQLRGTVRSKSLDSGERTARFRRDVEQAAGHAVRTYVRHNALEPFRDRLGDALERAFSGKRVVDTRERVPASPVSRGEPRALPPLLESRPKGKLDFDLGYSDGGPAVELQYVRRGLDLDVGIVGGSPEVKLEYERRGSSLRFGLRTGGEIGLEYRHLTTTGQSNVKVDFDAARDRYTATFVRKF